MEARFAKDEAEEGRGFEDGFPAPSELDDAYLRQTCRMRRRVVSIVPCVTIPARGRLLIHLFLPPET